MKMKNKILDILLTKGSLLTAVAIDIVILAVCFIVIAPGPLEAAGMLLLSLVVVLFAVRAWIEGGRIGKAVWLMFALVAFYFDLSFVLVSTDAQTKSAQVNTIEVAQAEAEYAKAVADFDKAQARYDDALKRGNSKDVLTQINGQLTDAKTILDKAKTRVDSLKTPEASKARVALTADSLSTAIVDALTSGKAGRIAFTFAFGLVFAGLQLTMVLAATGTRKQETAEAEAREASEPVKKERKKRTRLDDVERFVRIVWTNHRVDRSPGKATPWGTFANLTHGSYQQETYDKLFAECVRLKFIAEDRTIIERDEAKVIAALRKAQKLI